MAQPLEAMIFAEIKSFQKTLTLKIVLVVIKLVFIKLFDEGLVIYD